MFGFGNGGCCENSSTALWFLILILLLFINCGEDNTPCCQ